MATMGVRNLWQRASGLLRQTARGEVTRARGSIDDLPPPIPLAPGQDPASVVLARLRGDDGAPTP